MAAERAPCGVWIRTGTKAEKSVPSRRVPSQVAVTCAPLSTEAKTRRISVVAKQKEFGAPEPPWPPREGTPRASTDDAASRLPPLVRDSVSEPGATCEAEKGRVLPSRRRYWSGSALARFRS